MPMDIIWEDTGNVALIEQLQVLQNKAARIILDLPPAASATEALGNLRWKRLSRRRAEHRAIFIFKCLNNLSTHSFDLFLTENIMILIPSLRIMYIRLSQIGTGVFGTRQILPQRSEIIWTSP